MCLDRHFRVKYLRLGYEWTQKKESVFKTIRQDKYDTYY